MRGTLKLVAGVIGLWGCSNGGDSDPKLSSAVAMISTNNAGLSFAYTDADSSNRLQDVLSGLNPKTFHWVMVTVPPAHVADLATGLTADLSKPDSGVVFKQVYAGVCNPALRDFNQCWLFESYQAGDVGLTGSVRLTIANAFADGALEVSWEGDTDRFGPPVQHHQHGTSAGIHVPVTQYVQPGVTQ